MSAEQEAEMAAVIALSQQSAQREAQLRTQEEGDMEEGVLASIRMAAGADDGSAGSSEFVRQSRGHGKQPMWKRVSPPPLSSGLDASNDVVPTNAVAAHVMQLYEAVKDAEEANDPVALAAAKAAFVERNRAYAAKEFASLRKQVCASKRAVRAHACKLCSCRTPLTASHCSRCTLTHRPMTP